MASFAVHAVAVALCLTLIRSSIPPDAGPEVSVSLAFEAPEPAAVPEATPPAVETPRANDLPPTAPAADPTPPSAPPALPTPVTALPQAVNAAASAEEPSPVADAAALPVPPVPPPSPPALLHPVVRAVGRPPAQPPATAQPASGAPAAPMAPPPSPTHDDADTARWQKALGVWVDAHKLYPEAARRRREQGRVVIRVQIAQSGQVLDVALVNGSGSSRLDEAAATMLRGAHLPAPPTDMAVTVPIDYGLTP